MNTTADRDIMIGMTQRQAEAWDWAKGAMDGYWADAEEVVFEQDWPMDRAQAAVAFYAELVRMTIPHCLIFRGRERERQAREDVLGDLLYRLEEQLQDMAEEEGTKAAAGQAKAAMNLATMIRDRTPYGHDIEAI